METQSKLKMSIPFTQEVKQLVHMSSDTFKTKVYQKYIEIHGPKKMTFNVKYLILIL